MAHIPYFQFADLAYDSGAVSSQWLRKRGMHREKQINNTIVP